MILNRRCRPQLAAVTLLTTLTLGGCGYLPERTLTGSLSTEQNAVDSVKATPKAKANTKPRSRSGKVEGDTQYVKYSQSREIVASDRERECLVRAMYFESHRSSREGLMAVGTVVMNRVNSPSYPSTICGVVGQRRQFAPGVLSRPMSQRERQHADAIADEIFAGKRHAGIGDAMFFHVASRRYKYPNMRYLHVAGGNIFYKKVGRGAPRVIENSVLAYAGNSASTDENKTASASATITQDSPSTLTATAALETAIAPAASSFADKLASNNKLLNQDTEKEAAIAAAIVTAEAPAVTKISFTAPVDEALSRAQSFSKKPLILEAYRTAKSSNTKR